MKPFKFLSLVLQVLIVLESCKDKETTMEPENEVANSYYGEKYRPQFHFSPEHKWMNDPNGLVFNDGIYHLFYQYYPEDIVWGPMHWGHAISKDLIHWEHKPIALYPDQNGYIFSGSAVVDTANTSGLGKDGQQPLVAFFTYHDSEGEKAGDDDFQTQGMAYSLDNGASWTSYPQNPIIGNSGYKDFRDPKVFWNEMEQGWSMLLVAGDHLQIWNSQDLLNWNQVSEFGRNQGAHGGVWECPDLFPIKVDGDGDTKWVLFISINPGAPNEGSGTQYFIGDFDGKTFTTDQEGNRWLDWGTDNYAGVTYNNLPENKRILIGWMSNWLYAQKTPTKIWRSAMTIPRKLELKKIEGALYLFQNPVASLNSIVEDSRAKTITLAEQARDSFGIGENQQNEIQFETAATKFELELSNQNGESLRFLVDRNNKRCDLDRSQSGVVDFDENFASIQEMPISGLPEGSTIYRILLDQSSIEIFIGQGQYAMTAQLFPSEPYTQLHFKNLSESTVVINQLRIAEVKSVW